MKKKALKLKSLWSEFGRLNIYRGTYSGDLSKIESNLRSRTCSNILSSIEPIVYSNINSNLYLNFNESLNWGINTSLKEKMKQQ
jgi:hypothetical protein